MIKSRKIRWERQIARMREMRNADEGLVVKSEEKDKSEVLEIERRLLKCVLAKWVWKLWIESIKFGIWTGRGCCEHGNGTSGFLKSWKFRDQLSVLRRLASEVARFSMQLADYRSAPFDCHFISAHPCPCRHIAAQER
jgi:hypothetical protein